MHLKNIVNKHYVAVPPQPNQKLQMYKCRFCTTTYARHVSRMARHLSKQCRGCPQIVKDQLREKLKLKRDRRKKNHKHCTHSSSHSSSGTDEKMAFDSDTFTSVTEDIEKENEMPASLAESNSLSVQEGKSQPKMGASKIRSFCDTISKGDMAKGHKLLAKAIYASGTPLSMTENRHWKEFFTFLRPAFSLPSRIHISNKFLEDTYQELKKEVDKKIVAASSVGVQCDGWSDIRNEGVVNIIVTTPEPVFFKSVATGTNSETAEYIADELSKVIDEIGPSKVLGVCKDNAATMKAAWKKLGEKYDKLVFYGCAAHTLNLLIKDVTKQPTIERVTRSAKSVVREVKESHLLSQTFKDIQGKDAEGIKTTLKLPVITRWGSVVTCLNSLNVNKQNLQALAISPVGSHRLQKLTKTLLLDEEFWVQVKKVLHLIEPVASWITTLEGDSPRLSSVPEAFALLEEHFKDVLKCSSLSPLPAIETQAIFTALQTRRGMAVTPVHLAANILDPAYKGKKLSDEHVAGTVLIHELGLKFQLNVDKVLSELADYIAGEGLWQQEYVQQASSTINAAKWWKGICHKTCLSKIAQEVLNLPATLAATERSFSTHGWIHNAKRNRLTASRAAMIAYIAYNSRLRHDQRQKKKSDKSTSDESDLELDEDVDLEVVSEMEEEYQEVDYLDDVLLE